MTARLVTVFFALAALNFLATGCSSPPPIAREATAYSYDPPKEDKVDVVAAVIRPSFSEASMRSLKDGTLRWANHKGDVYNEHVLGDSSFKDLQAALYKSLQDLFLAKGINTRGPFKSIEDMTYPDKKATDLVFHSAFDVNLKHSEVAREGRGFFDNGVDWTWSIAISGNFQIKATEPLSGEVFWSKNLEFPGQAKITKFVASQGKASSQSRNNALENACSEVMREFFKDAMTKIGRYLSAEELLRLKKMAGEVKAKKRF